MKAVLRSLTAALIVALTPAHLRAELIAVESFDYAGDAALAGAGGGMGWQGAWFVSPLHHRDNLVASRALVFPPLSVAGRCLKEIGGDVRSFRKLDTSRREVASLITRGEHGPAFGKAGTTVWIGFLLAMETPSKPAYGGLHLCDGLGDVKQDAFGGKQAHQRISLGRSNTSKGWYLGRVTNGGPGAGKWDSGIVPDAATHFLVYRFDFHAGDVEAWLHLDPKPGATPSPPAAVIHAPGIAPFCFDTFSVGSGAGAVFYLDEIRIGTTFAEVAPQ